jgi:hypothetical protein
MSAMSGRCQTAIRGFSGFPAGSLPDLQFLPGGVPKSMIVLGFSAWGSPEIFYPEFSRAAGNRRGGATLPASAPLVPRQPSARHPWPDPAAHRRDTACAARAARGFESAATPDCATAPAPQISTGARASASNQNAPSPKIPSAGSTPASTRLPIKSRSVSVVPPPRVP